jgi:hypothetical protein
VSDGQLLQPFTQKQILLFGLFLLQMSVKTRPAHFR